MSRRIACRTSFCLGLLFLWTAAIHPARGQDSAIPTYERDIRPLLKKHCTACHNTRKVSDAEVSGGLALDTFEAIQAARQRKANLFSSGEQSLILQRLTSKDDEKRMPQGGEALEPAEISLVRHWLEGGLKQGEKVASADLAGSGSKSPSKVRTGTYTTNFRTPQGFMGGFAPKLLLQIPHGTLPPITALAYSPDGKILAVGSYRQIVLWDTELARPRAIVLDFPGAIHEVRFSPDGKSLLVAGGHAAAEGLAWIYDLQQSTWSHKLKAGQDLITSAAFDPAGPRVALGCSDKKVYLSSIETGLWKNTWSHTDVVTGVGLPRRDLVVVHRKDRAFKITSASSGKTKTTITGTDDEVLALAVHPNGKEAVSAGGDRNINWWDLNTGARLRRLRGHIRAVNDVGFDKAGSVLASVGSDQVLLLWNGYTGARQRTINAQTPLYSVALRPDGRQVAAGGYDGTTSIWDVASGRPLLTFLSFRDVKGIAQWLVYIPEGYVNASDGARESVQWTYPTRLEQNYFWKLLAKPDLVALAARGQPVTYPALRRQNSREPEVSDEESWQGTTVARMHRSYRHAPVGMPQRRRSNLYPMITHNPFGHPSAVNRQKSKHSGQMEFTAPQGDFRGTGLHADILPWPLGAKAGVAAKSVKRVWAEKNALCGVREFRIASDRGISSIGQFVVVDEPVVQEKEPNNTISQHCDRFSRGYPQGIEGQRRSIASVSGQGRCSSHI